MIQAWGEKVTEELHAICNQIRKEGSIPEEWTKSVIVTIRKKGDQSQCSNYRTIVLLSHVGIVLMMVLLERLKAQMERHLSEEQAGFRWDRSTVHQILILRLIVEKAIWKGRYFINWLPKGIRLDQTWCYLGNLQLLPVALYMLRVHQTCYPFGVGELVPISTG